MSGTSDSENAINTATNAVRRELGARKPKVAIVLGSGLGGLTSAVTDAVRIPYAGIPGFHVPTIIGHAGELVAGTLGSVPVIMQSGRFHMYEGHSAFESALPVRVFGALGVKTLIVTNAAGGIRRTFAPGTLMLISDHLNLTARNPLEGHVLPGETRFPDMTVAYDAELRAAAHQIAREQGTAVEEGIYAGLLGPSFETPAEIRMLEKLGADAVGMSTVMETIAARAMGMRVLGISTVTNAAAGVTGALLDHVEVMDVANQVAARLSRLIEGVVHTL